MIKIKFAGINDRGNACYCTEKGTYIEYFDGCFYSLNQCEAHGFVGINGEPDVRLKSSCLQIVDSF